MHPKITVTNHRLNKCKMKCAHNFSSFFFSSLRFSLLVISMFEFCVYTCCARMNIERSRFPFIYSAVWIVITEGIISFDSSFFFIRIFFFLANALHKRNELRRLFCECEYECDQKLHLFIRSIFGLLIL